LNENIHCIVQHRSHPDDVFGGQGTKGYNKQESMGDEAVRVAFEYECVHLFRIGTVEVFAVCFEKPIEEQ